MGELFLPHLHLMSFLIAIHLPPDEISSKNNRNLSSYFGIYCNWRRDIKEF